MSTRFTTNHKPISTIYDDKLGRKDISSILLDMIIENLGDGCMLGLIGAYGSGKSSLRSYIRLPDESAEEIKLMKEQGHVLPGTDDYIFVEINPWQLGDQNLCEHIVIEASKAIEDFNSRGGIQIPIHDKYKSDAIIISLFHEATADIDNARAQEFNQQIGNIQKHYKPSNLWAVIFVLLSLLMLAAHFGFNFALTDISPTNSLALVFCSGFAAMAALYKFIAEHTYKRAAELILGAEKNKVRFHLPAQLTSKPDIAVKILTSMAEDTERQKKGMVIWIEDIDRCDPDVARQMLAILKKLSGIPGVVFVVECDGRALSRSMNASTSTGDVDADALLQKLFDHVLYLPQLNAHLVELFLRSEGPKLGLGDDALKVINDIIDPNPRKIKRAIERTAVALKMLKDAEEYLNIININIKEQRPVAYIECIQEKWPLFWDKVCEEPHLLNFILKSDFSFSDATETKSDNDAQKSDPAHIGTILKACVQNEDDLQALLPDLAYGQLISPSSWNPYIYQYQREEGSDVYVNRTLLLMLIDAERYDEMSNLVAGYNTERSRKKLEYAIADYVSFKQYAALPRKKCFIAMLRILGDNSKHGHSKLRELALRIVCTSERHELVKHVDPCQIIKDIVIWGKDRGYNQDKLSDVATSVLNNEFNLTGHLHDEPYMEVLQIISNANFKHPTLLNNIRANLLQLLGQQSAWTPLKEIMGVLKKASAFVEGIFDRTFAESVVEHTVKNYGRKEDTIGFEASETIFTYYTNEIFWKTGDTAKRAFNDRLSFYYSGGKETPDEADGPVKLRRENARKLYGITSQNFKTQFADHKKDKK